MNAAQIIQFQKPSQPAQGAGKSMYSDKFDQGYVMSSRLYRKEVWPFLSDAARNVYAELENRINGHNKESDFVSYSQLQGSDLPGARQLSRRTVSTGLKELIKLGVITVLADGKQGMKSYRLNEISIKDQFTNETSLPSTPVHLGNQSGLPSTPVHLGNQSGLPSAPVTSVPSKHTIDTPIESLENNNYKAPAEFFPQDRGALNFIDYHSDDLAIYTLKELAGKYHIKNDFISQAKVSFPKLEEKTLLHEINRLARWSVGKPARRSQAWMVTWLDWLNKVGTPRPKAESKQPKAEQPKRHRYGQGVIPRGES